MDFRIINREDQRNLALDTKLNLKIGEAGPALSRKAGDAGISNSTVKSTAHQGSSPWKDGGVVNRSRQWRGEDVTVS